MLHKKAYISGWVSPTVHVGKGELWDADDPVVQSHPDWFVDPERGDDGVVHTSLGKNFVLANDTSVEGRMSLLREPGDHGASDEELARKAGLLNTPPEDVEQPAKAQQPKREASKQEKPHRGVRVNADSAEGTGGAHQEG